MGPSACCGWSGCRLAMGGDWGGDKAGGESASAVRVVPIQTVSSWQIRSSLSLRSNILLAAPRTSRATTFHPPSHYGFKP